MPRKFIDVYDLQDHTNEMKTEVVEIVKEVGGTGGSGTATNIADWAEKGNKDVIPVEKTNIAEWAVKDSTTVIPASTKCEVPTDAQGMFSETSTLGGLFESVSSSNTSFQEALNARATKDELNACATKEDLDKYVTTTALNEYNTSLNNTYGPIVSKISGVKEGVVLTATNSLNLDTLNTAVNTLNTNVTDLTTKVDTKANSTDVEGITSDISDIKTRVTTLESSSGSDEEVCLFYANNSGGIDKVLGEALSTPHSSLSLNSEGNSYLEQNILSLILGGQAIPIGDGCFNSGGNVPASTSFNYVFKAKILKTTNNSKYDSATKTSTNIITATVRLWYFDLTTKGLTIGDEKAEAVSLADALTIKSKDVTTTYTTHK